MGMAEYQLERGRVKTPKPNKLNISQEQRDQKA